MKDLFRLFTCALFLFYTSFCARVPEVRFTSDQQAEFQDKMHKADSLYGQGHYAGLMEALRLYGELIDHPVSKKNAELKYFKTAVLLGLKEKDLGIMSESHFVNAIHILESSPSISPYAKYLDIALAVPGKTRGVVKDGFNDYSKSLDFDWIRENAPVFFEELKTLGKKDEFFASLYVSFHSEFLYALSNEDKERYKDDYLWVKQAHPGSSLLNYQLAIVPHIDPDTLNSIVHLDPYFFEAKFYLGEIDIAKGLVLSAEKKLLPAYQAIPASSSIIFALTKIYFVIEEFEECLKYNEKVLEYAPEYRDALLGKAICLSYIGKHEDAIRTLNKVTGLGMYNMGESFYWLAWNYYELKNLESASRSITSAENYLIGHAEVLGLSGKIAFDSGDQEKAEYKLNDALKAGSTDCDIPFYLGKVYSQQQEWDKSGIYFEMAGRCSDVQSSAFKEKIKEIEESSFAAPRKKKHILKKQLQLKQSQVSAATAYYNAAAGYFNAGSIKKALRMARLSASHPALKEKAAELIQIIDAKVKE